MKKSLEKIAAEDGRYHPRGIMFVYDGLGHTMKNYTNEPQHVTGRTLCDGLKELALKRWGRLSKLVLNNWNIKTTRDFGEIVYLMIEYRWMSAQPSDTIEDFDNVYDFEQAFKSKL